LNAKQNVGLTPGLRLSWSHQIGSSTGIRLVKETGGNSGTTLDSDRAAEGNEFLKGLG
jgi:hypothetical protein